MAVTTRGYAQWGAPSSYSAAVVGGRGGWALDLATLWEDYAEATPSPRPSGTASARAFFDLRLGTRNTATPGRFSFDDLIGDIDGFLVGTRLANDASLRLQDAVRAVRVAIANDNKWRYVSFFQERFNGNVANARAAALDVFTSGNLAISGATALTIGGVTLETGTMGNGLIGPSNDEFVGTCGRVGFAAR